MREILQSPDEITDAWLSAALGREGLQVTATERIGTGQMSQNHRVTFTDNGGEPETVVIKLASADPTSRATGVGMGAYSREVSFYRRLAERLGAPIPSCHHAAYDEVDGWFTLVLDDVAGAHQGDQIAGCTLDEARTAVATLARIQAPVLGDLHVGSSDYLNQPNPLNQQLMTAVLPGFLERYEGRLAPEHIEVIERFAEVMDAWEADRRPPLGLVHGDYRLDNLLFSDGDCKVVDWQTLSWGPAVYDLSYFLSAALDPEDRRAHEGELVRLYHDGLMAHGVRNLTWEQCWEEYRRQTFGGIRMSVIAAMVVERTERGDDMFMTSLARNAQQILDLEALELLPEPNGGAPAPLRPEMADEGRHEPGPEDVWNESWYFDAVSDDGTLGVYTRLGRLPNQGAALVTAAIVGPGRPAVMVVHGDAPLPPLDDDAQRIAIDGLHVEQHCEVPLKRFRVTLTGTGEAHADESAPLRAEAGAPVDVAFDLVWETSAIPYQWRQSTRYEIPCRVTGTVRVGDEEIAFSGPGQRDHSWGPRDWFATGWMWSAFHLQDGTHTHAVGIPTMPGYGVGYVQSGDEISEVASLAMSEEIADNGLITTSEMTLGPDNLHLRVEPLAFGALRLDSPDGRVTHFPRAMARVSTNDGRVGTGWIEWNRPQSIGD